MSDCFYKLVRALGRPAFSHSSSPIVLHAHRVPAGGAILAPNHLSPYDIPCLMASTDRLLDFVSITELFRRPLRRWFLSSMNACALDRGRADPATTRVILDRLRRGRLVTMFPEGRIPRAEESMLITGRFRSSLLRLARLAESPIIPCVLLGTGAYAKPQAWRPGRRTRYAVAFGEPIRIGAEPQEVSRLEEVRAAYTELYRQLQTASGLTVYDHPWRG